MKPAQLFTLFAGTAAIVQGSLVRRVNTCTVCTDAVSTAIANLPANYQDADTFNALTKSCDDKSDETEAQACEAVISEYGADLTFVIRKEKDANKVCAEVIAGC